MGETEKALVENLDRRLQVSRNTQNAQPNNFRPKFATPSAPSVPPPTINKAVQQSSPVGVDQLPIDNLNRSSKRKEEEEEEEDNTDDDSDWDEFDDDDEALAAFRQRRLAELKIAHAHETENKAKGHGEVRTITQDEFLPECTGSYWVVVHFFHRDFERCKIMDHHLKRIAPLHLNCKFVRIDAEKAPFFVGKLNIKTLPTLLIFKDGKTVNRLLGFDGLSNSRNPDEFTTSSLGRFLESTGAIEYEGPESDEEGEESTSRRIVRNGMLQSRTTAYDEDI